jgi:hypothetical protein
MWVLPFFVPCIPPFLGALICFMIGRVSSFLFSCQACNQIWLKPSFGWWPTHIPHEFEGKKKNNTLNHQACIKVAKELKYVESI